MSWNFVRGSILTICLHSQKIVTFGGLRPWYQPFSSLFLYHNSGRYCSGCDFHFKKSGMAKMWPKSRVRALRAIIALRNRVCQQEQLLPLYVESKSQSKMILFRREEVFGIFCSGIFGHGMFCPGISCQGIFFHGKCFFFILEHQFYGDPNV